MSTLGSSSRGGTHFMCTLTCWQDDAAAEGAGAAEGTGVIWKKVAHMVHIEHIEHTQHTTHGTQHRAHGTRHTARSIHTALLLLLLLLLLLARSTHFPLSSSSLEENSMTTGEAPC